MARAGYAMTMARLGVPKVQLRELLQQQFLQAGCPTNSVKAPKVKYTQLFEVIISKRQNRSSQ